MHVKIGPRILQRLGACPAGIAWFKRAFPRGVNARWTLLHTLHVLRYVPWRYASFAVEKMLIPPPHLADAAAASADLAGSKWIGLSLDFAELSLANLSDVRWPRANAEQACFQRVTAAGASFTEMRGSGALFEHAQMRGATFTRAHVRYARFDSADLQAVDFTQVDASDTSFLHADLSGACFRGAKLCRANFTKAVINGSTSFTGADLTGARIPKSWGRVLPSLAGVRWV